MITQQELLETFEYRNGNLYRRTTKPGSRPIGSIAGFITKSGYASVNIDHKYYRIHRLIFLMHHGYLPDCVDHINGIKADNRIENLREASLAENTQNMRLVGANTSGAKHVNWDKKNKSWKVGLTAFGKKHHIGYFKDIEAAELVAHLAREKYHGDFARHI